jgi:hypothetical protein
MSQFDRPSTPCLSAEPQFTAPAVDPPEDTDEPGWLRVLADRAQDLLLSLGAATPRLMPAIQGVLFLVALAASASSWVAHALVALRRAAMWIAIGLSGAAICTFALCSPPRPPHVFEIGPDPDRRLLPASVASDEQLVASAR